MATKYYPSKAATTPSTVATSESAPRKYSSMSANSIQSFHSNHNGYYQASPATTPRGGGGGVGNILRNHYKSYSCPTTPVGTTAAATNYPVFPSSPTFPKNGHPAGLSLSPRTTAANYSKENHYFAANHPNLLQPRQQPQPLKQPSVQNQQKQKQKQTTTNNNTTETKSPEDPPLSPRSPSKADFAKSQADLNRTYWQRRAKFLATPHAARFETGRNLKHFQPLLIRTAEFC